LLSKELKKQQHNLASYPRCTSHISVEWVARQTLWASFQQ